MLRCAVYQRLSCADYAPGADYVRKNIFFQPRYAFADDRPGAYYSQENTVNNSAINQLDIEICILDG